MRFEKVPLLACYYRRYLLSAQSTSYSRYLVLGYLITWVCMLLLYRAVLSITPPLRSAQLDARTPAILPP